MRSPSKPRGRLSPRSYAGCRRAQSQCASAISLRQRAARPRQTAHCVGAAAYMDYVRKGGIQPLSCFSIAIRGEVDVNVHPPGGRRFRDPGLRAGS